MFRILVRLVSVGIIALLALPCGCLGIIGLHGTLSDTSERVNFQQGLTFLFIALILSALGGLGLWLYPDDDGS